MTHTKSLIQIILLLSSTAALANLPDEINYGPYYSDYRLKVTQISTKEYYLKDARENLSNTINEIEQNSNQIYTLNGEIDDSNYKIQSLENNIYQLETEIRQYENDLGILKSDLAYLEKDKSNLERQISDTRWDLRPLRNELEKHEKELKSIESTINRNNRDIENHKSKIANLKRDISKSEELLSSYNKKIAELKKTPEKNKRLISEVNRKIKDQEQKVSDLERQYRELESKKRALAKNVSAEKQKLEKLISSGAPADKVSAQKEKVSKLNKQYYDVNSKASEVERNARNIRSNTLPKLKNKIVSLEREIQSADYNISNTESQKVREKQKLSKIHIELERYKKNLSQLRNKKESLRQKRQTQIAAIEQNNADSLQLRRDLAHYESNLKDLENRISSKESSISQVDRSIRSNESDIWDANKMIPKIKSKIASDKSKIKNLTSLNAKLSTEQVVLEAKIPNLVDDIADLERDKDYFYDEYTRRERLYDQYMDEAQDLGTSQVTTAVALGSDHGEKESISLGLSNGKTVGAEYGKHLANLTGLVRGEVVGYTSGYDEGINSTTSIEEGKIKGQLDGKQAAIDEAQAKLKPVFFESHLKETLASTQVSDNLNKSELKTFYNIEFSNTKAFSNFIEIPLLTLEERDASLGFTTRLDSKIDLATKNEKDITIKHQKYQTPKFAYQNPKTLPYKKIDCSSVYKNIEEFIEACEESYKDEFKKVFVKSSFKQFSIDYKKRYLSSFEPIKSETMNSLYQSIFEDSEEVAFLEAKAIGEEKAFNESFTISFKNTYDQELPIESNIADNQAKQEVAEWIANNPMVSQVESKFEAKYFRGGANGEISIKLKNIGNKISETTGLIKIENSNNIILESSEYSLPNIEANSIAVLKIPFKINPSATSGNNISIQAKLILPGDKYKTIRTEDISILKTLTKNPKLHAEFQYLKFPKVKKTFGGYIIHSTKVNLAAMAEDLPEGYKVEIIPIADANKYVKLKNASAHTGNLKKGEQVEVALKYVFKKAAKKRKLQFKIVITYLDNIIKEEVLDISPK